MLFQTGFSDEQNIKLAEVLDYLKQNHNLEKQDQIIEDIVYRYVTSSLDKRWDGIPREILDIFNGLMQTFRKDLWSEVPIYLINFRDSYYQAYKQNLESINFEKVKVATEAKAAAEAIVAARLLENEKKEKIRLENAKQIDRIRDEKIELERKEARSRISKRAEDLRSQVNKLSQGGRMAVHHMLDVRYAEAVFDEAIALCLEALSNGEIEQAAKRIAELVLEGNPNCRALINRLSAGTQKSELVVAFLQIGKATKFAAPLWRGRKTDSGPVFDQLYAYNLSFRFTETMKQALDFSSYFVLSNDLASRREITRAIHECVKKEKVNIDEFMPTLVKCVPIEEMEVEFLKNSLKFPMLGDWKSRFYKLLDYDRTILQEVLYTLSYRNAEYVRLAYDEYLAINGDLDLVEQLLRSGRQTGYKAEVNDLTISLRAKYITILLHSGRGTNDLATQFLFYSGIAKNIETLKLMLSIEDLSDVNLIEVCRLLERNVDPNYLLSALDRYTVISDSPEFTQMRIRLLFEAEKLDDLILIDAETPFNEEEEVLQLALLTLKKDEFVACRQLLERKFGTFKSILDLEVMRQMSKSKLVDYLPFILKYEDINDPLIIMEVAELEIIENRKPIAANRLRQLILDGNAEAAALMLLAKEPNSETPLEELELALSTNNLELKIIAYREIAKRYTQLGNIEMAKLYAETVASEDIESAFLLATKLKGDWSEYWAIDVLDRIDAAGQASLKAKFIDYGFSQGSELEDYNLHKFLIAPKNQKLSSRHSNQGIRVSENWYCRKALLNETAFIKDEKMQLSYNFKCCKVHHVSFRQRVQFGFKVPSNHFIDVIGVQNFLQDSIPRPLNGEITPSMKLIIDELANEGHSLREWQKKAFIEWFQHGRQGMVEAVTGSGKSYLGALAAAEALDDGYAVLIVVPTQILCDQWIEGPLKALHKRNLVNKIGNARSNIAPDALAVVPGKITVGVMKSIVDNPELLPGSHINSCLIADEIHNYGGAETSKVLGANFRRRLGMTATLADSESLGFFKNYFGGDAIYTYDFETAVRDKAVSNFDLVLIGVKPNDLEKSLYTEAEYQAREAKEEIIKKFSIPKDAIGFENGIAALENAERGTELVLRYKTLKKRADSIVSSSQSKLKAIHTVADFVSARGNTIVFSDVNSNAKNVQQILANNGVLGEVVNAEVSPNDRRDFVQKLFAKKLSALISPKALDEGIDIKGLTVGLFVGVQGQRRRLIQRLGRVLRVQEGKSKPVVIIPFNVGSTEDPNVTGNERLQLGKFDFIGANADSISSFHVSDSERIKTYLNSLV